jgi:hypothetical protein
LTHDASRGATAPCDGTIRSLLSGLNLKEMNPMKPLEYRNPFVLMQDTAYTLVRENGNVVGLPRVGMFKIGRVVWLPVSGKMKTLPDTKIVVWAEKTGTVSISPSALAL